MKKRPYVWEMVKEAIDQLGEKTTYADIRQYIHSKYSDVNDSTITCQIIICTVNHKTRIHYPENSKPRVANTQYDFLYTTGRGQVEKYNPAKHGIWEIAEDENGKLFVTEDIQESPNENLAESKSDITQEENCHFPLESHLRDFIARNMETIEIHNRTLKLYISEDGTDGVEFRTNVGNIDILSVDDNGNYYIFELKLSRGNDATLGQLLRYMGWIKLNMDPSKDVYGVIIAQSIDEKLKYAVSQVTNIQLFEYNINFNIKAVS